MQITLTLPEKSRTLGTAVIGTYFVFEVDLVNLQERANVYKVESSDGFRNISSNLGFDINEDDPRPIKEVRITSMTFELAK